ncbi:hypothetical protein SEVIR_3G294800v4 [Setaria viridis]|uniref:Ubiquinol-cytochrome c reductase complex 6.7 kDa protein n=1 Tax=Setaria viridis TaxID=4556 RepID=A0A4V6D9Z5_SETVI|nr:ubiquinol-cytochrome c reductase complex 6.7 kDa protein [Setaria viridis]TKW27996.1 hypothetical protein SEVIR_3G294800v2 [Setaria viridis]
MRFAPTRMSHSKMLINSELNSQLPSVAAIVVLLCLCETATVKNSASRPASEMPAVPSTAQRLFKPLPPHRRPQSTDIAAVAGWMVAGLSTAIWLVQPFDWIKKTLFEKQQPEESNN